MWDNKKVLKLACIWAFYAPLPSWAQSVQSLQTSGILQASNIEGSGPILNTLLWLQGTLLGSVATTLAVIAIASVGFMMLTGRMNWRAGAGVVMGCFILFSAPSIAAGIQTVALTTR
jgi:type IV secretion system protein VirB2